MVRDEPADVEELRRRYAAETGDERDLFAFSFGDSPETAEALAELVAAGRKHATAGLLADYEHDDDPLPERGDRSIVLDGRGEGVCVIETVEASVRPLSAVDPAFAWDEGEGDRTLEDWLVGHRRFFARRCEHLGLSLSDHLPVVLQRFTVVWPDAPPPAPLAIGGDLAVRPLRFDERTWATGVLTERWGDPTVVAGGVAHAADGLPGLVAERRADGQRVGLATFRPWPGGEAEMVTLDSLEPGRGAGRLLLEGLEALGSREGWSRLRCVMTNDNTPALRLYQRAGWDLVALRPGAVDLARRHKPAVPETGVDGIPIRHELELVRDLA